MDRIIAWPAYQQGKVKGSATVFWRDRLTLRIRVWLICCSLSGDLVRRIRINVGPGGDALFQLYDVSRALWGGGGSVDPGTFAFSPECVRDVTAMRLYPDSRPPCHPLREVLRLALLAGKTPVGIFQLVIVLSSV